PDPRSVVFDFELTVTPSGGAGGTAYLDVSYGGSVIGSLSGTYAADLSDAYAFVGLWNGEGESEFSFLDYSFGAGTAGQLDLTPIPEPAGLGLIGIALLGLRKKRN
ncbi:MAG: hypothetical protein HQ546_10615, partial [Planctomycetes bacterium]|nr:hypothetical protein [Planctomycetota bacterium]